MRTVTTTPFGRRPVTADLLDHQAKGNGVSTLPSVGKWDVLNSLSVVRDQYGIGDRTLALLQVLLSGKVWLQEHNRWQGVQFFV